MLNTNKETNKNKQLSEESRIRIIINTVIVIAFNSGAIELSDLSIKFLFKDDFGLSPAHSQYLLVSTKLANLIKPIFGFMSDTYFLFGYRRKSYIICSACIQLMQWISLSSWIHTWQQAFVAINLIYVGHAFLNVIGEAIVVELSRDEDSDFQGLTDEQKQKHASKNVSLFFAFRNIAILCTSYTGGYLLHYITKQNIFAIQCFFPMCVFLYTLQYPEKQYPYQEKNNIDDKINQNQITNNQQPQQIESNDGEKNWKLLYKYITKPQIKIPLLFIFISSISPSTQSAMFYFYINKLNFSPDFTGQIRLVIALATLIGIAIYQKFLLNVNIKTQLFWTTVVGACIGITMILLVTGKNRALGIPDKVFVLTDSLIFQVINEINILPILVFTARMCPKNIEATMYALVTSVMHFGLLFSELLGGIMTQYFQVTSSNFDNLWKMILIQNFCVLLPLPLLFYINFDQAQDLAEKEDQILKDDSLEQEIILDDKTPLLQKKNSQDTKE